MKISEKILEVKGSKVESELKSLQKDFEKLYKSFQKPESELAQIMDKLQSVIDNHPDTQSEEFKKLKQLYAGLNGNLYYSIMKPLRQYDLRFAFKDLVSDVMGFKL